MSEQIIQELKNIKKESLYKYYKQSYSKDKMIEQLKTGAAKGFDTMSIFIDRDRNLADENKVKLKDDLFMKYLKEILPEFTIKKTEDNLTTMFGSTVEREKIDISWKDNNSNNQSQEKDS